MIWLLRICIVALLGACGVPVLAQTSIDVTTEFLLKKQELTAALAESGYKLREIKSGETLSMLAGPKWQETCQANKALDIIESCHLIKAGTKLWVPAVVKKAAAPRTHMVSSACITLGAAPFNPEHDVVRMLEGIDALTSLTPEQKEIGRTKYIRNEKASARQLVEGQLFTEMLYQSRVKGKGVVHVYGKPICSPEQGGQPEVMDSYYLGGGMYLAIPKRCGNVSVFNGSVPSTLPVAVRPPETVAPLPPPEERPEPLPPEEKPEPLTPPEPEPPLCALDPKGVLGQEHEPKHDGNDAHSTYLSAALDCTWRGVGGTHGLGIGLQGSWWHGKVDLGKGRFSGQLLAAGPSYEWIDDTGWNLEAKFLWGRLHEDFREGLYESHREVGIVGPAVSLNLGERRARGEKSFGETRLFGMLGLPTSVHAGHSYDSKPITDTGDLSKFGHYLNVGVHQDLYDFDKLTLWARLGYLQETPATETMNLRLGISDPWRIAGIGIGYDFDLKNGGEAKGWGWWVDIVKGVQVARDEYRLSQIMDDTGATFDEDGVLMVKPIKPTPKAGN